jgi:hypothetical protein
VKNPFTEAGFGSRKFLLVILAMALGFAAGCLAAAWVPFAPLFPEFTSFLLGCLAIYCGANVANKLGLKIGSKKKSKAPPAGE